WGRVLARIDPGVHCCSHSQKNFTFSLAILFAGCMISGSCILTFACTLPSITTAPLPKTAWLLGGLCHASPVPFRGSCFTVGLHPPTATPQQCIGHLYTRWDY